MAPKKLQINNSIGIYKKTEKVDFVFGSPKILLQTDVFTEMPLLNFFKIWKILKWRSCFYKKFQLLGQFLSKNLALWL